MSPSLALRCPPGRRYIVEQLDGDTWIATDDGDRRVRLDLDGVPGRPIVGTVELLSLSFELAQIVVEALNRRPVLTLVEVRP